MKGSPVKVNAMEVMEMRSDKKIKPPPLFKNKAKSQLNLTFSFTVTGIPALQHDKPSTK
jgi:hypothetical protein